MSDRLFERAVHDWLEEGSDRIPPAALDAVLFAVKTTPQQRVLRIPRRLNSMSTYLRLAAVALVAVVGTGGVLSFYGSWTGVPGGPTSTAPPTSSPAATPGRSFVAPGIPGWTTSTSDVYEGFGLGYPLDWPVRVPATRAWMAGDRFPADGLPYADKFFSAETESSQIGLFFWAVPAGSADIDSVEGLTAWAESFCNDVDALSCPEFAGQAAPMCANESGDCKPAIIVPTSTIQYAFVPNWETLEFFGREYAKIRIVVVAREDAFAPAARYGGSMELLKAVLTTMSVWGPN